MSSSLLLLPITSALRNLNAKVGLLYIGVVCTVVLGAREIYGEGCIRTGMWLILLSPVCRFTLTSFFNLFLYPSLPRVLVHVLFFLKLMTHVVIHVFFYLKNIYLFICLSSFFKFYKYFFPSHSKPLSFRFAAKYQARSLLNLCRPPIIVKSFESDRKEHRR